jgi:actin-related protein
MKAQEKPFTQRYPIQRGMFMNWDQMENMWNYCFKELNVSASE